MIRLVSLSARVTCRDDLALAFKALDLIWIRGVKAERCCTMGLDIVLAEQTIVRNCGVRAISWLDRWWTFLRLQVKPYRIDDFVVTR